MTPRAGYNHDLRYRNRVYHVQTEQRGAGQIVTHVFYGGTVIAQATAEGASGDGGASDAESSDLQAREQHKSLMRRLLRGHLDGDIQALLGELEPAPPQLKRYVHYLDHGGRTYSAETRFLKKATTDIYCDAVLIATESVSPGPAAAADVVKHWAQEQHKQLLLRLHEGAFDERIVELLGSLSPQPVMRRRPGTGQLRALEALATDAGESLVEPDDEVTREHYQHAMTYQGHTFYAETEQIGGEHPHVVAELRLGDEVITRKLQELDPSAGGAGAREVARRLHKELLSELKAGELDDVIELLDEL